MIVYARIVCAECGTEITEVNGEPVECAAVTPEDAPVVPCIGIHACEEAEYVEA